MKIHWLLKSIQASTLWLYSYPDKMRVNGTCIRVCRVSVSLGDFKCISVSYSLRAKCLYCFPTLPPMSLPPFISGRNRWCGYLGESWVSSRRLQRGPGRPCTVLNSCLVYFQFNGRLASVTSKGCDKSQWSPVQVSATATEGRGMKGWIWPPLVLFMSIPSHKVWHVHNGRFCSRRAWLLTARRALVSGSSPRALARHSGNRALPEMGTWDWL